MTPFSGGDTMPWFWILATIPTDVPAFLSIVNHNVRLVKTAIEMFKDILQPDYKAIHTHLQYRCVWFAATVASALLLACPLYRTPMFESFL